MYSEFARKASYKDFKIIYLKSRHRKICPERKLRKIAKTVFFKFSFALRCKQSMALFLLKLRMTFPHLK